MSVYLKVRLRRKNNIVEYYFYALNTWEKPDDEIMNSLNSSDFASWKDKNLIPGWILNHNDGYEYCIVNLRD